MHDLKLSLTASLILGEAKEVQNQSKQEFFSIKKCSRRCHTSKLIESAPTKKQFTRKDSNQYQIIKKLQNLDVKQLHYSLAETQDPDALLEFKSKQPKKKKLPSKIYSTQLAKRTSIDKNNRRVSQERNFKRANEMKNPIFFQKQDEEQKSNINKLTNSEKNEDKKEKIAFYSPKKIITKTLTTLFSNKVPLVQEKQEPDLSINDFHIIKQIGDGTYSKVFQAAHKKTGFICAIKILQKKLMRQLKVEENAIREVKILSCLSCHANITTLYGSFSDQNRIYLILQLCTDGDVHKKIKNLRENTKLNEFQSQQKRKLLEHKRMVETVNILRQICLALKELHENSIMHRDIKPENILVTMGNNIKLSDFGWSVYNPKDNLRKTLCGTPLYLAPQFITTCRYNDSIDIWSLGIMSYQLFTNQFPFKIETVNDLIKIAQEDINFSKIKCDTARDFCSKALVKDRHYRADIWELLEHQLFIKYPMAD